MSQITGGEAHFRMFVILWNQLAGIKTPQLHSTIADWLESRWKNKETRLLLMAFRASGKSTMAGLFAAWLLYRNPDLRILVLAADAALARKMVRQVKKIIERHPLTRKLKPDNADQWAGSRFTVKRNFDLRDPSMLARGITSNITGSRADVIICDDVEVPNTCDTDIKRAELRELLGENDYILTPGGTQLYIGTPHNYFSIYASEPREEIGEEREFLAGYKRLEIPVMDENGESAWPGKYSIAAMEEVKRQTGPNKFASQMMLQPVNIAEGRLNPELLQHYSQEIHYSKELGALFIGDKKMAGANAWWDPAFGSPKGDKSVVAAVFADDVGNYYLHRMLYLEAKEKYEEDEATYQCRRVCGLMKELYMPNIYVEENGVGKFLPGLLRRVIAQTSTSCSVVRVSNSRPKDIRIMEAFDAPLAAKRLFVHESVLRTRFFVEMREWRPGKRCADDGLDAVAGALSRHPIRLPHIPGTRRQEWMHGGKTHKARSDFDV